MRRRKRPNGDWWDRGDRRIPRQERRAQRREWHSYHKAQRREERQEHKALILNARRERRTRQQERRQTRKSRREDRKAERQGKRQERKTERKDRRTKRKTERHERRRERKEQRQERKAERTAQRQERKTQRKERRTERKAERTAQRQERKTERHERRQERKTERTAQRQERKTDRHERRRERKEQRQQRRTERHERRRERKEQREQRRTERKEQRQQRKTERQEQRQERRAERAEQRQERKAQRIERREQRRSDRRLRVKRAVVGTNRFLGRTRPPLPDPDFVETPTKSARTSVLSATLCLSLAALMVSDKIVEIADRLPLGADRDRWVVASEGADRVGNWLSLNRPYDALRELRGAGDDAGQRVDVIGDLEDLLAAGMASDAGSSSAVSTPTSTAVPSDGALTAATEDPSAVVATDDSDHRPSSSGETLEDPTAAQQDPQDSLGEAAEVVEDPTAATDGVPGTLSGELQTTSGSLVDPSLAGTEQPAVEPGEEDGLDPLEESEQTVVEPRLAPVSEQAPLRTHVAGDSQAFYLGVELRAGPLSKVLEVTLEDRHSTGLARPAYFNWPAQLLSVSSELDPELLVMTMGNNDWQDVRSQDNEILRRGSDLWRAEWGRRLGVMFDLMAAPHRHIVWVGLPPTRPDDFREGYAVMNEVAVEVAAARDFVTLIDVWEMFGGDEPYRASVPPPDDPEGSPVLVRQTDGVHLNRRGADWVVAIIEEGIRRIWDLVDS